MEPEAAGEPKKTTQKVLVNWEQSSFAILADKKEKGKSQANHGTTQKSPKKKE